MIVEDVHIPFEVISGDIEFVKSSSISILDETDVYAESTIVDHDVLVVFIIPSWYQTPKDKERDWAWDSY